MSESSTSAAQPETTVAPAAGTSAGALLRAAREAAGVHISALAVSLKVPVKKLEALESDDLAQLPDAVFARALAASVCRTLKIDPEPVLQLLPQLHAASLPAGGQGQPVRLDSHRGPRLSGSMNLPRPVMWLAAALLIAAAVVLLMPSWRGASEPSTTQVDPLPPAPQADAPLPDAPAPPAPAPIAASASSAMVSLTAPQEAASAAAAVAAVEAAASAATPTSEPVALAVFTTRAPVWVQVKGADGVVHLAKTIGAGETVRVNGALPLSVVVGRANAIDVQVRGKPFDLSTVAQGNVARFDIK